MGQVRLPQSISTNGSGTASSRLSRLCSPTDETLAIAISILLLQLRGDPEMRRVGLTTKALWMLIAAAILLLFHDLYAVSWPFMLVAAPAGLLLAAVPFSHAAQGFVLADDCNTSKRRLAAFVVGAVLLFAVFAMGTRLAA